MIDKKYDPQNIKKFKALIFALLIELDDEIDMFQYRPEWKNTSRKIITKIYQEIKKL
jgi:hypothetical protein